MPLPLRPLAVALLLITTTVVGCDTAEDGEGRIAQEVFVAAESARYIGPAPRQNGEPSLLFEYVGAVPAPCYEVRGYGVGSAGPPYDRYDVTVRAYATSETCRSQATALRVDSLWIPAPPSAGTYTYAFDRRERTPIEVEVTWP